MMIDSMRRPALAEIASANERRTAITRRPHGTGRPRRGEKALIALRDSRNVSPRRQGKWRRSECRPRETQLARSALDGAQAGRHFPDRKERIHETRDAPESRLRSLLVRHWLPIDTRCGILERRSGAAVRRPHHRGTFPNTGAAESAVCRPRQMIKQQALRPPISSPTIQSRLSAPLIQRPRRTHRRAERGEPGPED
jgi:hypothetical protein